MGRLGCVDDEWETVEILLLARLVNFLWIPQYGDVSYVIIM